MNRPITTLFMLMSLDGKISTGATDAFDFDKDLPQISGVKEGLQQYYDIEQTTDLWALNSGRVQAKMGVNEKEMPEKTPVSFALIDDFHLTEQGVRYFCARAQRLLIATSNRQHPAFNVKADKSSAFNGKPDNLSILYQDRRTDLKVVLEKLYSVFGCERITIQTGGTLNGEFLREKLLDYVDVVVAPVLVGGKNTASLVDGLSIMQADQLSGLGVLKLESVETLEHSYLRLRYQVVG